MNQIRLFGIFLLTLLLASCTGAGPVFVSPPVPSPSPVAATSQPAESGPVNSTGVIRFTQIGLEDGLSQSVINCILQDRQGFMWLGTQDGLNRYDGHNFKVYKPDPNDPNSLSDAWVTALYEDKDGFLWIGTSQGGLNKYDPRTGKFTRHLHNPKDGVSLSKGDVLAILQDNSGTIWAGTEDGLNRFEPASGTFTRFQNNPEDATSLSFNQVRAIFQDQQGKLWIGTNHGLNLFDPQKGSFRHYLNDPGNPDSISDSTILSVDEDEQGNLWIGTDNGLNRFDPLSEKFTRYLHDQRDPSSLENNTIFAVLIDSRGILWAGTESGLEQFDNVTGNFTHFHHNPLVQDSLSTDQVFSLYEDRENNLWVGTWGGGVNKYNRGQDKFGYYRYDPEQPNSLSDGGIFGLYADPSGMVWAGAYGSGLDRLDPTTGNVTHFIHNPKNPDSLGSTAVWALLRDHQGRLWVGTSNGLDEFNDKTMNFIHHIDKNNPNNNSRIYALYEDSDEKLWLGTSQGLDRYDPKFGRYIHYTRDDDKMNATPKGVRALLEDQDGYLWVATAEMGLYRLDRQTGSFQRYLHDPESLHSLPNNKVLALYHDNQGMLWVGTGGGGLSRFDPITQTFATYTERQGLPNNFIYCIVPDEQGILWISTNFGVSRFDPRTEKFTNYTISDGLQSNEFNQGACARAKDGAIYFGGLGGINRFYPARVGSNHYAPPVALTSLTQDGKPLQTGSTAELAEEFTLKWPQNSFEFEFAALSFAESQKNQFAYKLENFDSDWNTLGNQQSGRYTNLPGGTYTLRLKASNNDGVWNETGKSIKVTVIPPFWQTWWFYTLAGVFVAGSVTGLYQLRVRSVETQKLELERQVHERTREIENLFEQTKELAIIEERNRLARDLHDSAKQKAFAALAQIGTANGMINVNIKAAKEHLGEAENLVSDVIQELTFLIQEMYPLALKEKGLSTSLREYAFEWENRTDIPVSVKIDGGHRLKLEVEQALYRIVQESLANIARHSQASNATLNVHYNQTHIKVEIIDNGRGFVPGNSSNGIGLRLIHERAESVGGQVAIESEPGKGTRVLIDIPTENEN